MKINVISPSEFKRSAQGFNITYGFADAPFARALLAWCDRGLCFVGFAAGALEELAADMEGRWKGAAFTRDDAAAARLARKVFDPSACGDLELLLKGTPFQVEVWKRLLEIPFGGTVSYAEIASRAGKPRAVRAAGSAVGRNDLSCIVPCHRVLRGDGSLGGYYWGLPLKRSILDWERSVRG